MNNTFKNTFKTLTLGGALAACLAAPQMAQAQAGTNTHTFVSGTGSDGNPCTAASPCLTFTGALAQTAPGGTISALDSGDFGSATIAHSVTIDGTGALAAASVPPGILIFNALNRPALRRPALAPAQTPAQFTALTVTPGATTDVVVLRGLSFSGAANVNGTTAGVALTAPGTLLIEDCKFTQFSQAAINLLVSTGTVVVKKTAITNCPGAVGIQVGNVQSNNGTPSALLVSVKDSVIQGTASGIFTTSGMTDVSQTLIAQNTTAGLNGSAGTTVSASGCVISGNGTGVLSASGSVVRLTDNDILNNTMAMSAGGVISTTGNNRRAGNSTAMQPPIGGDAPNRTILQQ